MDVSLLFKWWRHDNYSDGHRVLDGENDVKSANILLDHVSL